MISWNSVTIFELPGIKKGMHVLVLQKHHFIGGKVLRIKLAQSFQLVQTWFGWTDDRNIFMLVKEPNWRNTLKGFKHTNCGVVEACLQFCDNGVQNDIVDINFEFLFSIIGVIINGCFVAFIEKCFFCGVFRLHNLLEGQELRNSPLFLQWWLQSDCC